ncbi:hypothetical protein HX871_06885 [Pseudomonas reactans]|uniref:Uncharacterized protein n=1 Tax=Pseudomonas reactans TaxID=117680 RepID=A0ABX2QQQ6_9PSED|nr:hypothetical protein [Pseudomonas reactans]NWA43798.1 hypothetical protein [Pseudomonas reactans]NWD94134.1 hypothetical protein [Pseudomonas reactans]NWF12181.1 hypothetical protein [Pseudomonas reactans]
MKFEDVPVRSVMRYTLCECGGRLVQVENAPVMLSFPAQYLHQCGICGRQQSLRCVSPSLAYEVA